MIFDELKTRDAKDVLLACCDNLKGISEALKAAFPNVRIEKCVIHQIRNSTKLLSPKDVASFTSDMKKFINHQAMIHVLKHLILLKKSWIEKYPYDFLIIQQKLEKWSTQQTQ